jgi:hypothetical protein
MYLNQEFTWFVLGVVPLGTTRTPVIQFTFEPYHCFTVVPDSGIGDEFLGVKEYRLLHVRFEVFVWTI